MTTTNMIGYGIPLVDVGCCCDRCCGREDCNTSFRDMADGYLARHQDLRNGVIFLDLRLGSEAAHDKIFKWNDIYLTNRAKTIQRWFRARAEYECSTIAVEMTFVNGKEYLIDRDTMHLYDIDTHLCMGQLDLRSMTIV